MRGTTRARIALFLVLGALVILAATASPAMAVIDGLSDVSGHYDTVGMFVVVVDGVVWGHGTCTLVDDDIVLTAAHNIPPGLGLDSFRVSFAADASDEDPYAPGFVGVKDVAIVPGYDPYSLVGVKDNSKRALLRNDLALVQLDTAPGLVPSRIIGSTNWLDGDEDLTSASFTVVGYGTTGFVAGSALSWNNPNTQMPFDGRRYKTVHVITESEAYADRYLKTTSGTSFGDSGGPLFFGDVLVGATVWGESMRCTSPAYEYRLDSPDAQAFLHDNLPGDCFVATP